jgi:formate hydrogenlyase subunit 6/NADH:ubiquinone oxidoreductase subunit I
MAKIRLSPMWREVVSQVLKTPATQQYPIVKPEVPEGLRGRQIFDIEHCIGCGLCASDCPTKAIEMIPVDEKKRPVFHLDRCVFCYQCAESCPRNAIKNSAFFELSSMNKSDLIISPKADGDKRSGEQDDP